MFLLILESLGTAELLLIGIVALMVFGPRKLPEMMRKAGKVMAEFRNTTSQFKESWEKEVAFDYEENEKKLIAEEISNTEKTIGKNSISKDSDKDLVPEIREINQEEFEFNFPSDEVKKIEQKDFEKSDANIKEVQIEVNEDIRDKRNWL